MREIFFKDVVASPCGVRFVFEELELQSTASRMALLNQSMMTTVDQIEEYHRQLQQHIGHHSHALDATLHMVRDIGNTIRNLSEGNTLCDTELFEIKHLATISVQTAECLSQMGIDNCSIPDMGDIVRLLNPTDGATSTFHIYDRYDERLPALRIAIESAQCSATDQTGKSSDEELDALVQQHLAVEAEVRRQLSAQLISSANRLRESLDALTRIDIFQAQARQIERWGYTLPQPVHGQPTSYTALIHPEYAAALNSRGKSFQPIDIALSTMPTTVIGANMGGKTVTLKSLALAQYMTQFGFGVDAQQAAVEVKDDMILCFDSGSSIELSSFATEMSHIAAAVERSAAGENLLVLIDEPARTTNPIEGEALVEALIDTFDNRRSFLVLSTHYRLERCRCRRLKVKGLTDSGMDYALEEVFDSDIPHEALAVAERLGICPRWIGRAKVIVKR